MADLEKLANILGADTIKKLYEDGASEPIKESSKILVDFIKAARLFTAPIQLLASFQDRLTKHFERIRNTVPEENQIEAPPSLSGPIIERLKYLEDDNYLTDLYVNLLARAIDKERVNEAHPAFLHIIDQLSPDEAYFLYRLKDKDIRLSSHMDYNKEKNWFSNYQITKTELPATELAFPENFHMYYSHMESLNLVSWTIESKEYPRNDEKIQTGIIENGKIALTDFGRWFVIACVPKDGFTFLNVNRETNDE